jgi:hypothetical protein
MNRHYRQIFHSELCMAYLMQPLTSDAADTRGQTRPSPTPDC